MTNAEFFKTVSESATRQNLPVKALMFKNAAFLCDNEAPTVSSPAAIDRIILFAVAGQVNCRFTGPHAERIIGLFGTDVLPSSFGLYNTSDSLREEIRRQIAALNPGVMVEWQ